MPRMRRPLPLLALLALLGACREDPVPGLEAEKRTLLESTLPKKAFWDEVEAKAKLLAEKRALDRELAGLQPQAATLGAEAEQTEASGESARQVNTQAAETLAHDRGEMERLEREVAKREARLDAFAERGRTPESVAAPGGAPAATEGGP